MGRPALATNRSQYGILLRARWIQHQIGPGIDGGDDAGASSPDRESPQSIGLSLLEPLSLGIPVKAVLRAVAKRFGAIPYAISQTLETLSIIASNRSSIRIQRPEGFSSFASVSSASSAQLKPLFQSGPRMV